MKLCERIQLPKAVQAMTVSPDGGRVAVVAGSRESVESDSTSAGQTLHLFRMAEGRLSAEGTFVLTGGAKAKGAKAAPELKYGCPRVAFVGDDSVVVARLERRGFDESVEVLGVDLAIGKQRGRALELPYPGFVSGLLPAPPRHLLLGTANTVVCLQASTLKETHRVREISDDGDPLEEDTVPEETIAPGGFVYDSNRRLLYVLTGCFEMGVLTCYRLRAGLKGSERRWRRDLFTTRPAMGMDLPAAGGLALTPGAEGVAALFNLDDLRLDLQGRPVTDLEELRAHALADGPADEVPLPLVSRIGWLTLAGERADTWVEVLSDTERDLEGRSEFGLDASGEMVPVGYQFFSSDAWDPLPVPIDDRRVAVVSPTGLVQLTNVTTGEATLEYDAEGSVASLAFSPEQRHLLLGGADGSLTALAVDEPAASLGAWQGAKVTVRVAKPKQTRAKPPLIAESEGFWVMPAGVCGSVAITPDGRRAACGRYVWDVERRWSLAAVEGCGCEVDSVALTPDGERLLTGVLGDNFIQLWEVASGRLLASMIGYGPMAVAFLPDGRRGVSGGRNGVVHVWDLGNACELFRLEGHEDAAVAVAVSPDGERVLSGSWDKTLRVWALDSRECLRVLTGHTNLVTSAAWAADGWRAISGSEDGTLRLWDAKTGQCLRVYEGHGCPVSSVAFTGHDQLVVSAGADQALRVWDVETGACRATLLGHVPPREQRGPRVAASSAGLVVSVARDVRLWDVTTEESLGVVGGNMGGWGPQVTLAPRGGHLLTLTTLRDWTVPCETGEGQTYLGEYALRVWDVEARNCVMTQTFTAERDGGRTHQSTALTPDGRIAASVHDHRLGHIWDVAEGRLLSTLDAQGAMLLCVTLSDDGGLAVTGGADGNVRLWETATGHCLAALEGHGKEIRSVALTPDGRRAAAGASDGTVRVWDTESRACVAVLQGHKNEVDAVALSPCGRRLASSAGAPAYLWDVETGRRLRALEGPSNMMPGSMLFTADGSRLIVAYMWAMRLFDVESGTALAEFRAEEHVPRYLALSEDGRTLLSANLRAIRRWRLPE